METCYKKIKHEDYDAFVEKFKPKKTTDDCYTPPEVYETIKNWVCKEYDINPEYIVRPFYPGGDYENFEYAENSVVVDNPPFSILSQILDFYIERKIPFFLFAPALTLFSSAKNRNLNYVVTDNTIVYENGAKVKTAFITSLGEYAIRTAPELENLISQAINRGHKRTIKFKYPNEVLTVNDLFKISRAGVEFKIERNDIFFIRQLEAQKNIKNAIFGGGFLLSKKVTAEKVKYLNKCEKCDAELIFQLSESEKATVDSLGEKNIEEVEE